MTGESVSTKQLLGTVLAVQANFYRVQMDEEGVRRESGVRSSEEERRNKEERNFSSAPCSLPPAPCSLPPAPCPRGVAPVTYSPKFKLVIFW